MNKKAWASFLAGEDEDEGNFFGETKPPDRPKTPNWFEKRTVDHGKVLQRRETHAFKMIRIETFYEDGYIDFVVSLDRHSYRDGSVFVDGIEYLNEAYYGRNGGGSEEKEISLKTSDPFDNNHDRATNRTRYADKSSKKHGKSQEDRSNLRPPNDLHPYLVGDFLIVEAEYEWPQLPEYNAYDPGEQMNLFTEEDTNVRATKKRTNKRRRRKNADPLRNFLR